MKHITPIVVLLATLALVGCGGGDGNASKTSDDTEAKPATPGEVVQQLAEAMEAGDAETLQALMPDLETKLGESVYVLAARMAESARAVGGVESVDIDDQTIDGDQAKVTATLTNGDGTSSTETFDLVKQDGKWVVTIDDSQVASDPGDASAE